MKRLLIAAALLVAMIIVCAVSHGLLDRHSERLLQNLDECSSLFEDMRYSECRKSAEALEERWIKSEEVLSFYVSRDRLEEIGENIGLLKIYAGRKNGDDFYSACETIRIILNHLQNDESWSF